MKTSKRRKTGPGDQPGPQGDQGKHEWEPDGGGPEKARHERAVTPTIQGQVVPHGLLIRGGRLPLDRDQAMNGMCFPGRDQQRIVRLRPKCRQGLLCQGREAFYHHLGTGIDQGQVEIIMSSQEVAKPLPVQLDGGNRRHFQEQIRQSVPLSAQLGRGTRLQLLRQGLESQHHRPACNDQAEQ